MVATGDHRYGDAAIYIPFFDAFIGFIQDPENYDVANKGRESPHWSELAQKQKA